MKFIQYLLVTPILVMIVSACTVVGAGDEAAAEPTLSIPTQEAVPPAVDDNLVDTSWTLVSFGPVGTETAVIEGTAVTLTFGPDGQAGGSGGCNSYGTEYEVQGSTLVFGEIVSTLMACVEEGVTEQEQRYLEVLRSAGEFELTGDRLMIRYDNGRGALNFVAAGSAGETPSPSAEGENSLVGTRWRLESFGPAAAERPVIAGSSVTIEFETAVQVVGSGGCNSYGGDYVVQGDAISFNQIIRTEVACADQAVTEQEQRYFSALETAESFAQTAERLTILYDDGQSVLNFVPADAADG